MTFTNLRELVELLGITAIVASLVFVGMELRQSRAISISEGNLANAEIQIERNNAINEHVNIWTRGNTGQPLNEDETVIFENLVKNALDSLAGNAGTIRIAFEGVVQGKARYLVSDDGPGVAPNLKATLFDVGVTTKESGWGVGLTLARRILVEMHHGNVKLRDTATGACFTIDLPLARGEQS